jgi:hypothetical protein
MKIRDLPISTFFSIAYNILEKVGDCNLEEKYISRKIKNATKLEVFH